MVKRPYFEKVALLRMNRLQKNPSRLSFENIISNEKPDVMYLPPQLAKEHIPVISFLSLLFFGASLFTVSTDYIGEMKTILRYLLSGIGVLGILFLFLIKRKKAIYHQQGRIKQGKIIAPVWIWIVFAYTVLITSALKGDFDLFFDGLWFLIGIPVIFFIMLPRLIPRNAHLVLSIALILSHLPYIILSLWSYPITLDYIIGYNVSQTYRGILHHFNSLATITLTSAIGFWGLLSFEIQPQKVRYSRIFLFVILLIGSFALIIITTSRTSSITFLVLLGIFLTQKKATNIRYIIAILTVLSIVLFFFYPNIHLLWYRITHKFFDTLYTNEPLNGRFGIWAKVFSEASLLGYNNQYFTTDFSAHNSFILVLGVYGIVATVLNVFFAVSSLWYSFQYVKKQEGKADAITHLMITTSFWLLSMSEGMFGSIGRGLTMAFMASLGVVITYFAREVQV